MPELKPCPDCGDAECLVVVQSLPSEEFSVHCGCGHTGRYCATEAESIAAWNALPRMSSIIAWQFQAAGAALALQRLISAAQAMRDEQRYWGNLIGTSTDMLITPAINQAACILENAEDAFDDLLAGMLKDTQAHHDSH